MSQDGILGCPTSERTISDSSHPAYVANRHSRAVQVHPGLTSWGIFSRPCGTCLMRLYTQDCVLGYSQPSLRDLILEWLILTETLKARDTARLKVGP